MARNKPPKKSGKAIRNKNKVDNMKAMGQIQRNLNDLEDKAYRRGFAHCAILNLFVLHMKEGYGKKRSQRVIVEYQEYIRAHYFAGALEEGKYQGLTIYDIADMLEDEIGVKINPDTGHFLTDNTYIPEGEESQ